jgi:hypothetical protein
MKKVRVWSEPPPKETDAPLPARSQPSVRLRKENFGVASPVSARLRALTAYVKWSNGVKTKATESELSASIAASAGVKNLEHFHAAPFAPIPQTESSKALEASARSHA